MSKETDEIIKKQTSNDYGSITRIAACMYKIAADHGFHENDGEELTTGHRRKGEVMPRWFMNLPSMPTVAAVSAAADKLGASRVGGYAAHDGLRANVEIDQSVAALLERAALETELRGCALEAIAEGWRPS